jgi:ABC-2 type transport system permease protein
MSFISDTLFVFRRQQRLLLRVPVFLIVGVLQPILYLALFGPLLTRLPAGTLSGGSGTGGTAEAYQFFVPGLLIQLALFGSTFVGFAIISDWRSGVIERYILILAGLAFGLRAPLGAVLLSYVYIVLVAIGLSSLSYATALRIKSEDAFAPLVNSVVLPLILLSGIMLPMTLGPGWLQGVARISPFRYIIDAMREAYAGHYWDAVTVEGLLVAVGLAAALLWLGSRVFVSENS